MDHTESWNVFCKEKQYSPEYGYWEKLTDAELYGGKVVRREFEKCFKDADTNKYKLTELALVLWQKYELFDKDDDEIYTELYYDLYSKVDTWACEKLDENEIIYYMRNAA